MSWAEIDPSSQQRIRSVCTPRQLQVVVLRSNDLTLEEIGQRLGITRQTAHQHLTVAHTKIRRLIDAPNGVPDKQKAEETRIITRIAKVDT